MNDMTGIDKTTKGNNLGKDKRSRPHLRKGTVSLLLVTAMVFSAVFIVINADGTSASHINEDHIAEGKLSEDGHHMPTVLLEKDDENGLMVEIVAFCILEELFIIGIVSVIRHR